MRIRALVVERKDAPFEDQEIELGEPGRGEVLVRIVASGVCHTDAITRAGDMGMPFPAVLAHEGAGVVERVGDGVSQVAVGDRVIIGWPSCGECRNCLDGQPRYCLRTGDALVSGRRFKGELRGTSAYSRNGQLLNGHFFGQSSFGTYSIASADALVKVGPNISIDLLGPLACGSTVDFAFDCTGVIPVIEKLAETVGMLGTVVLIGGAPAGARFSLDHLTTLWGKRVIGVLDGGGRSGQLITALVDLYQQGRIPVRPPGAVLRNGRNREGPFRLEIRRGRQACASHIRLRSYELRTKPRLNLKSATQTSCERRWRLTELPAR